MAYYKAELNASKMSDDDVITKLEVIGRSFTGSTRYLNPPQTGVSYTAMGAEGRAKKLASIGGDEAAMAAYHDFLKGARAALKLVVGYVNSIAAGDKTAVMESGLDCSTPNKRGVQNPHSAKSSDTPGAIDIFYRPHARCGGVSHQVCVDPPTEAGYLPQKMSLPGKFTWTGLTSGTKVWTRSCFAIAGGQSAWTDPIPVSVK